MKPSALTKPEPTPPKAPIKTTVAAFDKIKPEYTKKALGLANINGKVLHSTYLSEQSFNTGIATLNSKVIPNKSWVSLTWVRFGFRHKATKQIDKAIADYQVELTRFISKKQPKSIGEVINYTNEISQRTRFLQNEILVWVEEWFKDKENRNHKQSKRLQYMEHLRRFADREYKELKDIRQQYIQCLKTDKENIKQKGIFDKQLVAFNQAKAQHQADEMQAERSYQIAYQQYEKDMAVYDRALEEYRSAVEKHEKAMQSYQHKLKVHGVNTEVWKQRGQVLGAF